MFCFKCDKEFNSKDNWSWSATPFSGSPGYGSRFDNCCSGGQHLKIIICDHCLETFFYRINKVNVDKEITHTEDQWNGKGE